jgi:hypothetical protein
MLTTRAEYVRNSAEEDIAGPVVTRVETLSQALRAQHIHQDAVVQVRISTAAQM